MLTQQLAPQCSRVTGIDTDAAILRSTASTLAPLTNVELIHGDAMHYPLPEAAFDFIASIATLHHLPLKPALERFSTF